MEQILQGLVPELWVVLRGDFVRNIKDRRAIDAEFVRAELPTGNRPTPDSKLPEEQLGIQGGLFESWFTIKPKKINSAI